MTKPHRKLTPKRQAFVAKLVGPPAVSGAEAARQAGYAPGSARQRAHELVTNSDVQSAVERMRARVAARAELSAAQVLADIDEIGALAQDGGDLAVALRARELLGKAIGLYDKRSTQITMKVDTSAELLAAMHRQTQRRAAEPLDITPPNASTHLS